MSSLVFDFVDDGPLNAGDALHDDVRQHLHEGLQLEQEGDLPLFLNRRMHRDLPELFNPSVCQGLDGRKVPDC